MAQRIAFVTGAASGIGRAIAQRLASDGLQVVVSDINLAGAQAVTDEIGSAGGSAVAVECDVADMSSVEDALEAVGGCDVLVNNAGFDEPQFFLKSDPDSWIRLITVNLLGVLHCTYVLAPVIAERNNDGRIVNIASDAGRVGALGEAVYSATKGGVIAFSKSMARELARDGITVNAICPGPVETPLVQSFRGTEMGDMLMERMIKATPMRRLGEPDEVAAAASYFASPEARFVTGQVLSISGGLTMSG